ncbi:MAG: hypothetical protein PHY44_01705 [Lachnospiraceae bacterium]|nr:hypothetical protein [Lachnospiraceae bacterium]
MKQIEYLTETNATADDLLDIIAAQNALISQQASEIKELSKATYSPPVVKDGVLVQCAVTAISQKRPTAQGNKEIKWYEDKLIKPTLKVI